MEAKTHDGQWSHIVSVESTSKFYCPNNCGRSYNNKGNLNRHLRYECGVEPQFQCDQCSYLTKHKDHLRKHVLLKHTAIKIQI
ncbi:longitudinals lacking protein, isoforms A/B/D/L-like isoform X1 [Nilaparvata lugens]|uniref:longitudinals lacking protein, isoforms A/B/D/L-like isoform X1 n=1 Tax=Nilaparvata lugens TaxID=108931 RepID=UPI00193CD988|nr:longitudinals lacking protein, isoforms A/B/D/L-like isoform X1 [Nilaparvata lugens]